jgi:hypothetical protein
MGGENEDEDLFDMTIGTLEEIIMDDEFQNMQARFRPTPGPALPHELAQSACWPLSVRSTLG